MRSLTLVLIFAASAGILVWRFHQRIREDPVLLQRLVWQTIRFRFIHRDGLAESESGKTTSESQSYALIAAVFMNDKDAFDRVWAWTRENLERDDGLFAWRWESGSVTDYHTAPDADEDIAFALIIASKKWSEPRYREEAQVILKSFWEKDTSLVAGRRYITGGDWAQGDESGAIVNPSYLSPFHYSLFAEYDREHPWESLIPSSYDILRQCSGEKGLAKDWCKLDHAGMLLETFEFGGKDPNVYSYDAFRVPFRLAVDYQNSSSPEAFALLKASTEWTRTEWETQKKVYARYHQNGEKAGPEESPAAYGALLAAFSMLEHDDAKDLYRAKISTLRLWLSNPSFYDLAWVWFGLSFYNGDFRQ
ncbi:MAG: hypothetical protein HY471_02180 [Candidatus Sungbacteria bacterium]|nr:hypothetical protein [Candidatus Sungbacteria bacterium]